MSGGIITNEGKKIMLDRTYSSVPTRAEVTLFKVGIGATDTTLTDTDLVQAIPIIGTESVDTCETADWSDGADATTSLNSTTFKQGDNSLNLVKDGAAGTTCDTSKATTSRDFTSKELSIWIYVKDAAALAKLTTTDCLEIRFGSSSGDYYQWLKDKADLTAGQWNLITGLTTTNADATVGAPTIGACDYTYISLEATGSAIVWIAGDFMFDDVKVISSDDYLKIYEAGYPTLDYTNLQATLRMRLNTQNSNGYLVTEVGIFNVDGTPKMESRDTFNPISKSEDDEIIFVIKNLIE